MKNDKRKTSRDLHLGIVPWSSVVWTFSGTGQCLGQPYSLQSTTKNGNSLMVVLVAKVYSRGQRTNFYLSEECMQHLGPRLFRFLFRLSKIVEKRRFLRNLSHEVFRPGSKIATFCKERTEFG